MVFIHPADEEITPEVVQDFIDLHKAEIPRYLKLKQLYESNAPILSQQAKESYKPDNRLVVNYAKYIVDTFNGYFIGIPAKINHEKEEIDKGVDSFWDRNDMDDNFAELSKLSSIYGHSFLYLYQNEESETRCTYNSPLDMFIVYDDTIAQNPLFVVRYQETDDGIKGQLFTRHEEKDILPSKEGITFGNEEQRHYGDVQIIEYIENEERQSIFEPVVTLIDAFDKALSEKANDVDYFADAYLAILGAELDDKGIHRIRDNRIINMFGTDDASKIIVQFLDKPDGDETQEHLLDRIERLIYQMSMVANINDESFGNASGVSLEFKLQPMKNLAAMKERKFTSGLNKLFKMWFNLPTNVPASQKDEWHNLEYKFTRNIPRNVADEAEIAGNLAGIVSKETQLSVLSIVDNVKNEIDKMEAETEKGSSGYQTDKNGDFILNGAE